MASPNKASKIRLPLLESSATNNCLFKTLSAFSWPPYPAIPIRMALCPPKPDRRVKPGDDDTSWRIVLEARASQTRAAIERTRVGREGRTRRGVEIEHVAALVEPDPRAIRPAVGRPAHSG